MPPYWVARLQVLCAHVNYAWFAGCSGGANEFTGGLNARKYLAITKVSKATATRDLQALVKLGVLLAIGGGRSSRYQLNLE